MKTYLTQEYLQSKGFTRDETAANVNNRWHRMDGETHFDSTYYISITFSNMEGQNAAYGIINTLEPPHGYQRLHWVFEHGELRKGALGPRIQIQEPITVECFENILSEMNIKL